MNKLTVLCLLVSAFGLAASAFAATPGKGVQVVADEAQRRIDVTIDGKPFTSYIWPTTLKKPVLYPIVTDEGVTVTRGYPLDPQPIKQVEGLGQIDGLDDWPGLGEGLKGVGEGMLQARQIQHGGAGLSGQAREIAHHVGGGAQGLAEGAPAAIASNPKVIEAYLGRGAVGSGAAELAASAEKGGQI